MFDVRLVLVLDEGVFDKNEELNERRGAGAKADDVGPSAINEKEMIEKLRP
jgi:hypothetical protein